jgi:hypothetical protein
MDYSFFGGSHVTAIRQTFAARGIGSADDLPAKSTLTVQLSYNEGVKDRVLKLHSAYPNPFNPSTTIRFDVPTEGFVSLKVYVVLGREVATLVNARMTAGNHNITWDASDFPSGVYFYRLTAGSFIQTQKMLVLK